MYREGIPGLELFLLKDVPEVPADGRYHIMLRGTLRESFASKKQARAAYSALRERLIKDTKFATGHVRQPPSVILEKERVEMGIKAGTKEKRTKALRKQANKYGSRTFG